MRDLGTFELWEQSLQRSRVRRKPPVLGTTRPVRGRPRGRGARRLGLAGGVTAALALLLLTGAQVSGGQVSRGWARALRPASAEALGLPPVLRASLTVAPASVAGHPRCRPVAAPEGYVNPLAHAKLSPERIDQGVDYAGSGTLVALGPARVTQVGTSGTGWPGAYIAYQLLAGPDAGCFVFYAEGVRPAHGLHRGLRLYAGRPVATIVAGWPTGIEIGWGTAQTSTTYAARYGRWTAGDDADNRASASGKVFSALVARLGGPPGKVEG